MVDDYPEVKERQRRGYGAKSKRTNERREAVVKY
jgi:hypothetical protein